jgi:hypothetical protein
VSNWSAVLLAAAALTVVHALIITSARFRIPLELLLMPFTALTIVAAGEFGQRARQWRSWAPPVKRRHTADGLINANP